jgi:hypothetical protein
MDTIRNSGGDGIYKLVPSLLDSTLAIAYLTTADNDDLFEPRFLARTLVRVAKVNDTDHVMIGLRPFYTNNETKNYLIEGLKSEFENFVHVDDLRKDYNSNMQSFQASVNAKWEVSNGRETCDDCDGDGECWDGECENCEGSGYVNSDSREYFPYVDDPDFLEFGYNFVKLKLPTDYLVKMGYMEKPEPKVSPLQQFLAC